MPLRVQRIESTLSQLEAGDLKLRVRVLEGERANRRQGIMQVRRRAGGGAGAWRGGEEGWGDGGMGGWGDGGEEGRRGEREGRSWIGMAHEMVTGW